MYRNRGRSRQSLNGWLLLLVVALALMGARRCISERSVVRAVKQSSARTMTVKRSIASEPTFPDTTVDSLTSEASAECVPSGLELPRCDRPSQLIRNPAGRYTLLYDKSARQARWVAYVLTRREVLVRGTDRSNHFVPDPAVVRRGWPTADGDDYRGSGYDRGHLLPSADRNDTPLENEATFLYSNVSPQKKGLNHGVWLKLEEQVREWAKRFDTIYVVTGGDLIKLSRRIGSGVAVPSRFFKAVLTRRNGDWQAIGFLIPNANNLDSDLFKYAESVDQIEQQMQLDLFEALDDPVERRVESSYDRSDWPQ